MAEEIKVEPKQEDGFPVMIYLPSEERSAADQFKLITSSQNFPGAVPFVIIHRKASNDDVRLANKVKSAIDKFPKSK